MSFYVKFLFLFSFFKLGNLNIQKVKIIPSKCSRKSCQIFHCNTGNRIKTKSSQNVMKFQIWSNCSTTTTTGKSRRHRKTLFSCMQLTLIQGKIFLALTTTLHFNVEYSIRSYDWKIKNVTCRAANPSGPAIRILAVRKKKSDSKNV